MVVGALLPGPAGAIATTSVSAGVLTITGSTGGDSATVTCVGGNVKIDNADPGTGVATCASLTEIVANMDDGADYVATNQVTAALFPSLTSISLNGGDDNDGMTGGELAEEMEGDSGNDTLEGRGGDDDIDGGNGTDHVNGFGTGTLTLTDTSLSGTTLGTDTLASIEEAQLLGTAGVETLDASTFSGSVSLIGNESADTLMGGGGDDSISGMGADVITGGNGNDRIFPGGNGTTIDGGGDTDTIAGSADVLLLTDTSLVVNASETNTLTSIEAAELSVSAGGTADASGATFPVILDIAGGGLGVLEGGSAGDTLTGSSSNDMLRGNGGADTIEGWGGKDDLIGGDGGDDLDGGDGGDTLKGNDGGDDLDGRAGNDTCKGGSGNNTLRRCEK